jgi:hypothetical protein
MFKFYGLGGFAATVAHGDVLNLSSAADFLHGVFTVLDVKYGTAGAVGAAVVFYLPGVIV